MNPLLILARPTDQKIEFLKKKHGVTPEQVELAIQTDPTENLYVEWLLVKLKRGEWDQSTSGELKTALEKFNKTKTSPEFRAQHSSDINKWLPGELIELFQEKGLDESAKSKTQQEKDWFSGEREGAKIVWQEGPWKVYEVTKVAAAMVLGSNTSWCTASNAGYARSYLKQGPLWIVYKNDKPWGQASRDEFRDVRDRSFSGMSFPPKDYQEFIKTCPLNRFSKIRYTPPKITWKNAVEAFESGVDWGVCVGAIKQSRASKTERGKQFLALHIVANRPPEEADKLIFDNPDLRGIAQWFFHDGRVPSVIRHPQTHEVASQVVRYLGNGLAIQNVTKKVYAGKNPNDLTTDDLYLLNNLEQVMPNITSPPRRLGEFMGEGHSLTNFKNYPWFPTWAQETKSRLIKDLERRAARKEDLRYASDSPLDALAEVGRLTEEELAHLLSLNLRVNHSEWLGLVNKRSPTLEEYLYKWTEEEDDDASLLRDYAQKFGLRFKLGSLAGFRIRAKLNRLTS